MPDPQYQDLLDRVKSAFPQPTSDRVHDAYFVFTIMKALDSLDQLKSDRPYLGERHPLDYRRAQDRRFPLPMGDMENTISEVLTYLEGLMIWGHPNTQENVVPPTTIPSSWEICLPASTTPTSSGTPIRTGWRRRKWNACPWSVI